MINGYFWFCFYNTALKSVRMANRNPGMISNGAQYNEDNRKLKGKYIEYKCLAGHLFYRALKNESKI